MTVTAATTRSRRNPAPREAAATAAAPAPVDDATPAPETAPDHGAEAPPVAAEPPAAATGDPKVADDSAAPQIAADEAGVRDEATPPAGGTLSDSARGDGGAGDSSAADESDAGREAALARSLALAVLAAGDGPEESPGGSGEVPAPSSTDLNGTVHEWGGDESYVVSTFMFNAIVNGSHHTAYRGDVVRPVAEVVGRGRQLGALEPLPAPGVDLSDVDPWEVDDPYDV